MLRPQRVPALGIRTSIALLIVVATLPGVFMFVNEAIQERDRREIEARESLERIVRLASELPDHTLEGARQLLYAASQIAPNLLTGPREACHDYFLRLRDNSDGLYHSMGLVLPNGDVVCNAAAMARGINIADRRHFRMAMESGFAVGSFQIGRATGDPGLNVAYPVQTAQAGRVGVVFAGFSLERMAEQIAGLPLRDGAVLTYTDFEGTVLVRQPAAGAAMGKPIPDEKLRNALKGDGVLEHVAPDGRTWVHAHRGIWKNADGRPAVHAIVGLPSEQIYGDARRNLLRSLAWAGAATALLIVLATWGVEVLVMRGIRRMLRASARVREGDLSARAQLVWGPVELLRLGAAFDRMAQSLEEREAQSRDLMQQLHAQATTDPLTGLANRRSFDDFLRRELSRAARTSAPLALIAVDIDHFKRINDRFGHDVGDQVLKAVTGALLSGVRDSDMAARLGGEEFAVVLPGVSRDKAIERAEALRNAVASLVLESGPVSASFGVALYPEHGADGAALLRAADESLYAAKGAGRNRVVIGGEAPTT